jgi:hypothetical protein
MPGQSSGSSVAGTPIAEIVLELSMGRCGLLLMKRMDQSPALPTGSFAKP